MDARVAGEVVTVLAGLGVRRAGPLLSRQLPPAGGRHEVEALVMEVAADLVRPPLTRSVTVEASNLIGRAGGQPTRSG